MGNVTLVEVTWELGEKFNVMAQGRRIGQVYRHLGNPYWWGVRGAGDKRDREYLNEFQGRNVTAREEAVRWVVEG